MTQTDRQLIAKWWDEAWNEGLWAASWSQSLDGLTAEQAAWSPAPGRHSIWKLALHMIFWRHSWIRRAATGIKPTDAEIARDNFPEITNPSEASWAATRRVFEDTQKQIAEILKKPDPACEPLMQFLPHDCYHFGQINYLRAMQGLKPIE
ncbi:MAG: DinB family protein [Phycisphaerales bacterium]|nr:DinB family protein [Phycisphaerales bacterium]